MRCKGSHAVYLDYAITINESQYYIFLELRDPVFCIFPEQCFSNCVALIRYRVSCVHSQGRNWTC